MSCCKGNKDKLAEAVVKPNNARSIKDYIFKFIIFLFLGAIISVVIIPVVLVILFRLVVLSKEINILPFVYYIAKKLFKENEEDDEDDDDEDDDEEYEDYELTNEDEIIIINNPE